MGSVVVPVMETRLKTCPPTPQSVPTKGGAGDVEFQEYEDYEEEEEEYDIDEEEDDEDAGNTQKWDGVSEFGQVRAWVGWVGRSEVMTRNGKCCCSGDGNIPFKLGLYGMRPALRRQMQLLNAGDLTGCQISILRNNNTLPFPLTSAFASEKVRN